MMSPNAWWLDLLIQQPLKALCDLRAFFVSLTNDLAHQQTFV